MLGYKQVDKNTPHHPDFRLIYLEIAQNSHIFQGAVSTKQMVGELRIALDTTSYLHCRSFGDYPAPYNGRSANLALPSGCPTNGSTSVLRTCSATRIRSLLYAGKPNWDLLSAVMPRQDGDLPNIAVPGIVSTRVKIT